MLDVLSLEEQELISQDQKHTSNVARIHCRKKRSRVVAEKGNHCIKKLRGESGEQLDSSLKKLVSVSRGRKTPSRTQTFSLHRAVPNL